MIAADLHGEAAERTVPPYMKGVVQDLRERGHTVAVRRSDRNGSWYYRIDGDKERRANQVCHRFREYGY
jgi:hypothetical protein